MENSELISIEQQIGKLNYSEGAIAELVQLIDEIYIILHENNRVVIYSQKLSFIKSELACLETADEKKKEKIFSASQKELLEILKESTAQG
ncbi:MAG: hypothetical protein H0U95_11220 [Bacteroidetes bacterium]|nr:hypothetical protein [Bacteroidota bacterium]